MTGSAKQSMERQRKTGLLRRFAPKKKQTDKLLILFNVMDEPPPSVLFHPRGSAKGRCGTRNDEKTAHLADCTSSQPVNSGTCSCSLPWWRRSPPGLRRDPAPPGSRRRCPTDS